MAAAQPPAPAKVGAVQRDRLASRRGRVRARDGHGDTYKSGAGEPWPPTVTCTFPPAPAGSTHVTFETAEVAETPSLTVTALNPDGVKVGAEQGEGLVAGGEGRGALLRSGSR